MQTEELKKLVIKAIDDLKGENIVEIDVMGKTSVTDVMVIASGTSSRHVKSIANNVADEAKKAGVKPLGVEGEEQAEWVLVDLGDVVVHIMQPHIREFYDLEKLWLFDAPEERNAI
ncbi:MAG: ribosome silencing factor [Gammaproteobacteria bacterium]|nr:ribosome silencing factor [Gammaproteobacteria bacterium]MCW8910046.1 ribosome silencing factor [Gammaproteobacteria bacterium]MCW9005365.1 ribosome silencing factor [Gammaproteobacteria bacterium]MCW9057086.1 ribosome silencing factor [Gammaproteobacteria bacterium]